MTKLDSQSEVGNFRTFLDQMTSKTGTPRMRALAEALDEYNRKNPLESMTDEQIEEYILPE